MFGIKFRTWMESHIVRPRKKQRGPKDGSAGANGSKGKNGKIVPEATLPAAVRLATNTPALFKKDETPEVLRCTVTSIVHTTGCSAVEPIALSTLHHDCYPRREANNLSSPESAYSTGYSTDGTSPGAGAPFTPPEYYINIRTGTHYFLPNANTPAPAGRDQSATSPAPKKPTGTVHFAAPAPSRVCDPKSGRTPPGHRGSGAVAAGCVARQCPPAACHENAYGYTFKNPAAFLSSPKAVSSLVSNHPNGYAHNHRRTESCDESRRLRSSLDLHDSIPSLSSPRHAPPPPPPLTTAQLTASPRQRTRIRTNPWLTANSGNANIPTGGTNSSNSSIYKTVKSTTSSGSGLQKAVDECNLSHGSSSDKVLSRRKCVPQQLNRGSSCSLSSTSSCRSTSDATDDDVTLNEMMGKYDESYIYEKETDILSDSDPTDCDETDFEAGQEGGDERDTQDEEELDFIDNGSLLDLPLDLDLDNAYGATNKGHCTYHDFVRKPRYRESVRRRSTTRAKDDKASPVLKRGSTRKEHCSSRGSRDGSKGRKLDSSSGSCSQNNCRGPSEKRRTRNMVHKSARERNLQTKNRLDGNVVNDKSNIGEVGSGSILSFKDILLQKMLSRENSVGTRSAGSTPISSRRKVFTKEVYSPKKTLHAYSNALLNMNKELNLDETLLNSDIQKRRSNSVCYVRSSNEVCVGNKHSAAYSSELALIEADKEADLKYKQLIMEAETILTTMKDQIPMKSLTHIPKPNFFTRKSDLVGGHPSPNLERKDFSKTFLEKDVSQFKSDLTIESPSFVRRTQTRRECVRVVEKRISPCVSANDSGDDVKAYDSNSDGSLTPHQEDFDEQPAQPFKALNRQIARLDDTHSSDEYEERSKASPVRKPDGQSSYKSSKERGYKNGGRRDIAITSIRSLNHPRVSDETIVDRNEKKDRQEVPIRCDTSVYRKVTTPLLERRLNIIKSSECVQRRDPMLRGMEESSSKELKPNPARLVKSPTMIGAPRPQLVAFRSVDLGNELDDSGYCPQSEPVKRKVYTCSATFDRLQKSLAEKGQLTKTGRDSERGQDDSRNSLREQLERLRRERDGKDHVNGNELSPAHHCDTAQKLSLIRRQMLVNTIEGLKRSLEDQSAKLQATYCSQAPGQSNSLQLKNS